MKISRKKITGVVVSHNMKKTVVVAVSRTFRHPRYKKYLHGVKTFKVHDERDACSVNDVVEIIETRPLSKEKKWRVTRIIDHAKSTMEKSRHEGKYGKDMHHPRQGPGEDGPPTVTEAGEHGSRVEGK